ncbi:hypothetical protein AB6809_34560 [Paraburkholderia sp. RCC_158]
MHIERDLACFDTEEEAVEVAQQLAFVWIGERERGVAGELEKRGPAA